MKIYENMDYRKITENLEQLMKDISEFSNSIIDTEIVDILNAYLFKKPLTIIEIHEEFEVAQAINQILDEYFFTYLNTYDDNYHTINLSRFKTIIKIVEEFEIKDQKMTDTIADIVGILVGYSAKDVSYYCFENNPDLIKK